MERSILKKKWIRKWRWEIAAQIHKDYLEKVLREGTEKARHLAEPNLKEIRNVVGFI